MTGDDQREIDAALAQLETTVGDPGFAGELIGDFLAALPAQLADLHAARTAGDMELLRRVAHTIKGNATTFGAEAFAVACRELEYAARDGRADTGDLLVRVEAEAARATPALSAARDERTP